MKRIWVNGQIILSQSCMIFGYSGKFGLNIWMTLGGCLNWCFTCFGMQAPDLLLHSFISEDRSIKWNNHGVSRQGLHNLAEAAYPCSRSWISDERCTCLLPVTPQVASTQVCECQLQWRVLGVRKAVFTLPSPCRLKGLHALATYHCCGSLPFQAQPQGHTTRSRRVRATGSGAALEAFSGTVLSGFTVASDLSFGNEKSWFLPFRPWRGRRLNVYYFYVMYIINVKA